MESRGLILQFWGKQSLFVNSRIANDPRVAPHPIFGAICRIGDSCVVITMGNSFPPSATSNDRALAIDYLATAYAEHGYKAVAQALRACGPNAEKFKIEVRAIELAIAEVRKQAASSSQIVAPGAKRMAYN